MRLRPRVRRRAAGSTETSALGPSLVGGFGAWATSNTLDQLRGSAARPAILHLPTRADTKRILKSAAFLEHADCAVRCSTNMRGCGVRSWPNLGGGSGNGLLLTKLTFRDFPPVPQSSICRRALAQCSNERIFSKTIFFQWGSSGPCRIRSGDGMVGNRVCPAIHADGPSCPSWWSARRPRRKLRQPGS